MSYVYKDTGRPLWTVGYYDPAGKWEAETDWGTAEEAAARCCYLNGGHTPGLEIRLANMEAEVRRISEMLAGFFKGLAGRGA